MTISLFNLKFEILFLASLGLLTVLCLAKTSIRAHCVGALAPERCSLRSVDSVQVNGEADVIVTHVKGHEGSAGATRGV